MDGVGDVAVRALGEARQRHPAVLLALVGLHLDCTTGMSTCSRLSTSVLGRPASSTPSFTVVPTGPLISVVAWSDVVPASGRPLTDTMMSPIFRPPFSAGEPLKTSSTLSPRLTLVTDIPTPSNRPSVSSWKLE